MIVIPSLDLERGRVVKRERGEEGTGLLDLGDPAAWARRWERLGARRLHVVDLDGAAGHGTNREIVGALVREARVPVQVGGGFRTPRDVRGALDAGAQRVVLSTSVWEDASWRAAAVREFGPQVGFALDVRDGRLTLRGWKVPGPGLSEALAELRRAGVRWLVYTDVAHEGTRRGLEREALRTVRRGFAGELHVAGGIGSREELRALASEGVDAAIVGRALYDGSLSADVAAEAF